MLDLPWKNTTELNSDFDKAESQLNADHYGLEKVKDRILEQMAVMINNPDGKAPIICLVGAPGVGKHLLASLLPRHSGATISEWPSADFTMKRKSAVIVAHTSVRCPAV